MTVNEKKSSDDYWKLWAFFPIVVLFLLMSGYAAGMSHVAWFWLALTGWFGGVSLGWNKFRQSHEKAEKQESRHLEVKSYLLGLSDAGKAYVEHAMDDESSDRTQRFIESLEELSELAKSRYLDS